MYKAYLAGLSGEQLQFMSLSETEATAFAIGVYDKAHDAYPKSRRQLEDAVVHELIPPILHLVDAFQVCDAVIAAASKRDYEAVDRLLGVIRK